MTFKDLLERAERNLAHTTSPPHREFWEAKVRELSYESLREEGESEPTA